MLFWGCLLAVAITFPLVFGWIYFTQRSRRSDDLCDLPVRLPAWRLSTAHVHRRSAFSRTRYFGHSSSSAGIALSLWRRMRDQGHAPFKRSAWTFLPLILLFAISITGLALTVSQDMAARSVSTASSRSCTRSP